MRKIDLETEGRDLIELYLPSIKTAAADELAIGLGPGIDFGASASVLGKTLPEAILMIVSVGSRETWWGHAPGYYDVEGTPDNREDDRGDRGHGWGLLQFDAGAHPAFCWTGKWSDRFGKPRTGDPRKLYDAVRAAVDLLLANERYLRKRCPGRTDDEYRRGAVAAYNCGSGNVRLSWQAGRSEDSRTHNHDYSHDVIDNLLPQWAEVLENSQSADSDPSPAVDQPSPSPGSDEGTTGGYPLKRSESMNEELKTKLEELNEKIQDGVEDIRAAVEPILEHLAREGEDFGRAFGVGLVLGPDAWAKVKIRGDEQAEKSGFDFGCQVRGILMGIMTRELSSKGLGEVLRFFGIKGVS